MDDNSLGQIEHFIVLALENRSFDHMLGYLDHPNPTYKGVGKLDAPLTTPNARYAIYPGPDHSHMGVMEQVLGTTTPPNDNYKPTMSGFASSYERRSPGHGDKVLRCFDPSMVPVLSKLALEFAVCDQWFCSLPGETFPNRDFIHAGTSFGRVGGGTVAPMFGNPPTIFSLLETGHKTWRAYHSGVAHCLLYAQLFLGRDRQGSHDRLIADIRGNALPNYAFVEPDYGIPGRGNSQHPAQARSREEFIDGEAFISRIYEALRQTPDVFAKTAFIITYDEHGGFYDHVSPMEVYTPEAKPYSIYRNGAYEFAFKLSGPRVPAVVVSPWVRKNTVCHMEREHSCIGETLRKRFLENLCLPLNDRAEGTDLGALFSLDAPRTGDDLPTTSPLSYADAITLENQLGAAADDTDLSPQLDVAHQTAIGDLESWVTGHGLPF